MRLFSQQDPYAPIASSYDAVVGPFLRPMRREVCRLAVQNRIFDFLDICCGTGEQCEMLAGLGLSVIGVDLSPAMLSTARARSSGNVRYLQEDASNLSFADGSFDGALISLALHEKSTELQDAILHEALRVLRKDGKLLIVDYSIPQTRKGKAALKMLTIAEWLAGAEHYLNFKLYIKAGATDSLLHEHGLSLLDRQLFLWGALTMTLAKHP